MTAKQYLRQLQRLSTNIEILTAEVQERRDRLTSLQSPGLKERVQSSAKGDQFAEAIAILADRDRQRQVLILDYEELRDSIVEQILGLDNDLQRAVLYKRYVERRTLLEIAAQEQYSYSRVCHIHGEALAAFTKKYLLTKC